MAGMYRPRHPERTVHYRVLFHHFERFVMFSCRTRGFCPSCHAKRLEEWGEWMRETLLLDVPHRQVVFTIPKMLRIFFKLKRKLLGDICRLALRALTRYFEVVTGSALTPGVVAAIQTFGDRINFHPLCGEQEGCRTRMCSINKTCVGGTSATSHYATLHMTSLMWSST